MARSRAAPAGSRARSHVAPATGQRRCAIYTRKSSEEGLEQAFNSLDAQREACAAYIASQRHEGWRALPTRYDDGGLSGGTLERPALQRLLADIRARTVDLVVVYKVDRLTRSLADFARIVDVFDASGVSFVSVTQQFNTTTSMGRLTLNMLLSFAQFEREVTGERIRDKIAASKRKGMWMGGTPPLGYDVADRKLVTNPAEAATVRRIFEAYLRLGCVRALQAELAAGGVRSKQRVAASGRCHGGHVITRGHLCHILRNRTYRGEIAHRGAVHQGAHDAIVDAGLWDQVQARLAARRPVPTGGAARTGPGRSASLLAGMIHDDQGRAMLPTHAVKQGRRYRYYVARALVTGLRSAAPDALRLPAAEVERLVIARLGGWLVTAADVQAAIAPRLDPALLPAALRAAHALAEDWPDAQPERLRPMLACLGTQVVVGRERMAIGFDPAGLAPLLLGEPAPALGGMPRRHTSDPRPNTANAGSTDAKPEPDPEPGGCGSASGRVVLTIAARLQRAGLFMTLQGADAPAVRDPDPTLLRLLGRALRFRARLQAADGTSLEQCAAAEAVTASYFTRVLRLAYLAPDILDAVAEGRHPATLTAARLLRAPNLPLAWSAQKAALNQD